jgi:beta-xylosidase
MDKITESIKKNGFSKIWAADMEDGTFRNPIIYADYSDPDVIRVGEDFFMVSSSFGCSPALPVLHSKDLVNWKIVNNIIDKLPFEVYDTPQYGKGVWAPSLRYHDGMYWVYFSTPDEGIFMTKTEDPFGKWSELKLVKEVKGWIDPCPFWDEDGKAYLVNAFAASRAGFNSILNISKMKVDGTELLDEGTYVFDGNKNEHHTIEGPKMYKRNGYYYIFAPAGGVVGGWQTILRSKNIYGPYEDKIVLHQGNTDINGPHQGGYIELDNGEGWFLHFQDREAYGRIIHLQPVKWVEDWPIMGEDINGDGIGEPVLRYKKPAVGKSYPVSVTETSDDFNSDKLSLQWQWNANYKDNWYSLTDRKDHIRLYAVNDVLKGGRTIYHAPNLLLQKYPAPSFTATTKLEFNPVNKNEKAGLIISGNHCFSLALYKSDNGIRIGYFKAYDEQGERHEEEVEGREISTSEVIMRVTVEEGANCSFSYSVDGEHFESIGGSFKATTTLWMGSKLGIYCVGLNEKASEAYADFDWFLIEEI